MRTRTISLFLLLAMSLGTGHTKTAEQVYAEAAPSIVSIYAKTSQGKKQGSGVVIDRGFVVTNCHVIEGSNATVVNWEDKLLPAYLYYSYKERDLCKLSVMGLSAPWVTLSRNPVRVGQKVYAIGSPRGLERTLSDGLISSVRSFESRYEMLQISAPITFGSSGGGLFDENAELIGITTKGLESANLNFAMPAPLVVELGVKGKLFGKDKDSDYESISYSIASLISRELSGEKFQKVRIDDIEQQKKYANWVDEIARRLRKWMPDQSLEYRRNFIEVVWYESTRAGIAPELTLGLIQVSSQFQHSYISSSGDRGYMAVDPAWTRKVGDGDPSKLFHLQIGLRYGLSLLRLIVDQERGDLFLALGRYAGQPGKSEFPNKVQKAWQQWEVKN